MSSNCLGKGSTVVRDFNKAILKSETISNPFDIFSIICAYCTTELKEGSPCTLTAKLGGYQLSDILPSTNY